MDEQITTTQTQKTSYHKKRKLVLIITGIILLLIVAVGAFWIIHHHKKPRLSPQATLQQLDASSQPVKTTVQQRAAALSEMDKNSVHYVVTPQQKLNTLNALK